MNRYKELYNHKTKQDAAMKNIRRQSALALALAETEAQSQGKQGLGPGPAQGQGLGAGSAARTSPRATAASTDTTAAAAAAVSAISASPDPLAIEGFVNIRVKPPLHTRGIRRMTLPADVTITICGPSFTESQRSLLQALEAFFGSLDSGFIAASVVCHFLYTTCQHDLSTHFLSTTSLITSLLYTPSINAPSHNPSLLTPL